MDFCKTKLICLLVASIFQSNWSPKRVFWEAKFFSGPGCAFVSEDRRSVMTRSYITSASLHESGHRVVKKIVSNLDVFDESTRKKIMNSLALDVDVLSVDRYGVDVLKTLGSGMQ